MVTMVPVFLLVDQAPQPGLPLDDVVGTPATQGRQEEPAAQWDLHRVKSPLAEPSCSSPR